MAVKKPVGLSIVPIALCALMGCQASAEEIDGKTTSAENAAIVETLPVTNPSVPETHKRVIDLVVAGENARATNDVKTLLQTAQTLRDMGAHPIAGTEDLAKNWTVMAETMQTDDTAPIPFRGRINGPAYRKQNLIPAGSDTIEDIYYAAELAELTLETLSGTPLSWSVYEAGSEQDKICHSVEETNTQSCRFTPLWTAKYKIRILNDSSQAASYLFITN
ncbi:hypothetical protein GCM10009069_04870 [Algimonas arctica]|uniref:Uncharacterized protein n=1 Tax=Algimonas arctica TaxID=1479486 RepID=A0A8J3CPZ1_9PROT|nr:hypothetical protein [Algimonas arctica]GHA84778.1 hypothetical protein GCM10009069_04870 [Algimonas arctica]